MTALTDTTVLSFPTWQQHLHAAALPGPTITRYERAIIAFLHFCKVQHAPATVALIRQYLKREPMARDALCWFYRESAYTAAPTRRAADTASPTWHAADTAGPTRQAAVTVGRDGYSAARSTRRQNRRDGGVASPGGALSNQRDEGRVDGSANAAGGVYGGADAAGRACGGADAAQIRI